MSRKQAVRIAAKAYRRYGRWCRRFPDNAARYWATYERACARVGVAPYPF